MIPKTTSVKESRLVDFPTFSEGNQDSVNWIETFKQACKANNVTKERMIAIVPLYLKGTALSWFKKSNILT